MANNAGPPPTVTNKKRKRDDTVKKGKDKAKSSINGTSSLFPKDYVESKDERATRHAKALGEQAKSILLRLYQAGSLPEAEYDNLSILPDGDIGRKNGKPLEGSVAAGASHETCGASTSQPLAVPAEQTQVDLASQERPLRVVNALGKRPPRYCWAWASLQYSLQQDINNGTSITLGELQERIRQCKMTHLQAIVKCLELLKPVVSGDHSSGWGDFQEQLRSLQSWFFPLFGIPWRGKKPSTARVWDQAWLEMSADVMELKNGKLLVVAINDLKAEKRPDDPAEDEKTLETIVNLLRGWLFYLKDENGIITKVEDAFDFGIPMPDMACPEEEKKIMALCEGLDEFNKGPSGCHAGPAFVYSRRFFYSDYSH